MARIIELFGLPGSGKSFLANALSTALAESDLTILRRSEAVKSCLQRKNDGFMTSLFKKLPSILWHRIVHEHYCLPELMDFSSEHIEITSFYYNKLQQNNVSAQAIRNIIGAFIMSCVERQLIDRYGRDDELILLDEGFCHRCFTLYGNLRISYTEEDVKQYVSLLPRCHGAIFVAASPDVSIERMKSRNRFPELLASQSDTALLKILRHGFLLLDQMATKLEQQEIACCRYDGHSTDLESLKSFCLSAVN